MRFPLLAHVDELQLLTGGQQVTQKFRGNIGVNRFGVGSQAILIPIFPKLTDPTALRTYR